MIEISEHPTDSSSQVVRDMNDQLAPSINENSLSVIWQPGNLQTEVAELYRDLFNTVDIDVIGVAAQELNEPPSTEFWDAEIASSSDPSNFDLPPASLLLFDNYNSRSPGGLFRNATPVPNISKPSVEDFNLEDLFPASERGDFGIEPLPQRESIHNSEFPFSIPAQIDNIDYGTTLADLGIQIQERAETATIRAFMETCASMESNTMLTETLQPQSTTMERGVQTDDIGYHCQASNAMTKAKSLKPRHKTNHCTGAQLNNGNAISRDLTTKRFGAISSLSNLGHVAMQASLAEWQIIGTGRGELKSAPFVAMREDLYNSNQI